MQGERGEKYTLVSVQANFRSRSGGHAPTDWTIGNYSIEAVLHFSRHLSRDSSAKIFFSRNEINRSHSACNTCRAILTFSNDRYAINFPFYRFTHWLCVRISLAEQQDISANFFSRTINDMTVKNEEVPDCHIILGIVSCNND